jgi:hypothetical protein
LQGNAEGVLQVAINPPFELASKEAFSEKPKVDWPNFANSFKLQPRHFVQSQKRLCLLAVTCAETFEVKIRHRP